MFNKLNLLEQPKINNSFNKFNKVIIKDEILIYMKKNYKITVYD